MIGIGAPAQIILVYGRLRALLRRLRVEREGHAAVEFGMVVLPFFAIIFAVLEIAFLFMTGQALDTSLDEAARLLLTGQAQTSSGSGAINSMSTFLNLALCPKLPAIISCTNAGTLGYLQVNVAQITSFTNANLGAPISNGVLDTSSWGYTPCTSGQIMKVEAVYPVAALTSFWTSANTVTLNGIKQRVLYSSTVFRCEPF
ncbi:MAG: pilus assembly protein [Methylobacteriaceae bacterium]|nr:pilus assembly protein [Methylobacteriaceae bacterium]MBV9245808.1 pilus assembly protein [Methylobacteriaceae bacterium]MBV9637114.1 pilus assembly protein [Methylobacteriaceae bacterium]